MEQGRTTRTGAEETRKTGTAEKQTPTQTQNAGLIHPGALQRTIHHDYQYTPINDPVEYQRIYAVLDGFLQKVANDAIQRSIILVDDSRGAQPIVGARQLQVNDYQYVAMRTPILSRLE